VASKFVKSAKYDLLSSTVQVFGVKQNTDVDADFKIFGKVANKN
jgi:hypothetical protein